jgi:hypothetical protein
MQLRSNTSKEVNYPTRDVRSQDLLLFKIFTSTSRFFRETPITKALGGLLEKYKHYRKFACESKNEMKHVLQT